MEYGPLITELHTGHLYWEDGKHIPSESLKIHRFVHRDLQPASTTVARGAFQISVSSDPDRTSYKLLTLFTSRNVFMKSHVYFVSSFINPGAAVGWDSGLHGGMVEDIVHGQRALS